ncbi:MAG: glycerol-3-phosphate 1-O-acyltransferase PlsY [Armatimonadetes bacterium]|nr:glycerol-3-phosphate 1-O-acyltransferase PlsY [Armatimonadota bacterium]
MASALAATIVSYLFGAIPIGLLVGRAHGIDDIRKYGSGNIGASNVLRLLGAKLGLTVWLLDALKGYVPVALAMHVLGVEGWWLAAVAVAAIAGHCFSPYLRFTGGKGVSTSLGVIIGLDWRAGLICFGLWIVIVALTRYISLGSMIGSGMAAPVLWLLRQEAPVILAGGLIGALVIERHRSNIQRLLTGTERRIGQREQVTPQHGEQP